MVICLDRILKAECHSPPASTMVKILLGFSQLTGEFPGGKACKSLEHPMPVGVRDFTLEQ